MFCQLFCIKIRLRRKQSHLYELYIGVARLNMKLVLIRHGESEWNKLNLFTGWTDVDLSDKGREEAKQAGKLLVKEGYDF